MFPESGVGHFLSAIYIGLPFISLLIGIALITKKINQEDYWETFQPYYAYKKLAFEAVW